MPYTRSPKRGDQEEAVMFADGQTRLATTSLNPIAFACYIYRECLQDGTLQISVSVSRNAGNDADKAVGEKAHVIDASTKVSKGYQMVTFRGSRLRPAAAGLRRGRRPSPESVRGRPLAASTDFPFRLKESRK
jgi:hypothetical protein